MNIFSPLYSAKNLNIVLVVNYFPSLTNRAMIAACSQEMIFVPFSRVWKKMMTILVRHTWIDLITSKESQRGC